MRPSLRHLIPSAVAVFVCSLFPAFLGLSLFAHQDQHLQAPPRPAIFLLAFAALIGLFNFHLSWARPLLHRLRGRPRSTLPHDSGIPLIGAILALIATCLDFGKATTAAIGLALLLIDTGSPVWLAIQICRGALWDDRDPPQQNRAA